MAAVAAAAVTRSRSQPNSRCCPCMKNGRCIRCQCVKKGSPCVDCRPSTVMPSRCENSVSPNDAPTAAPAATDPNEATDPQPSSQSFSPRLHPDGSYPEIEPLTSLLRQPRKILKRIPRLSRVTAARKLADAVQQVVARNDVPSWARLLSFPKRCFGTPRRGGKRWSLATLVNRQVSRNHWKPRRLPPSHYIVPRVAEIAIRSTS